MGKIWIYNFFRAAFGKNSKKKTLYFDFTVIKNICLPRTQQVNMHSILSGIFPRQSQSGKAWTTLSYPILYPYTVSNILVVEYSSHLFSIIWIPGLVFPLDFLQNSILIFDQAGFQISCCPRKTSLFLPQ